MDRNRILGDELLESEFKLKDTNVGLEEKQDQYNELREYVE
jgi:hypothetical protein